MSVPGPPLGLTAQTLNAMTTGSGTMSHSEASVENLNLTVDTHTITASILSSEATAQCAPGPMVSGDSVVADLNLDGTPITVSGMPNQTVTVGPVTLIINQQIMSVMGDTGDITVNALHVIVSNVGDVIISSSHADITCAPQPVTCPPICIPVPEICNDMIDNDCDNLIDCVDPDCPACPLIRRDPSVIRFGKPGMGLDFFKSHGRGTLAAPAEPLTERVGWLLSNANGPIYRAVLMPGDLIPTGRRMRFTFHDPGAPHGHGIRGGIYSAKIEVFLGVVHYRLRAYGDMSEATEPEMAIQFYVGDQVFVWQVTWIRTPGGWVAMPAPIVR